MLYMVPVPTYGVPVPIFIYFYAAPRLKKGESIIKKVRQIFANYKNKCEKCEINKLTGFLMAVP